MLANGRPGGAVGNGTYEETAFDKPGQPAVTNDTYEALGDHDRPRDGAVANSLYDVVDPLANGGDNTYGDVIQYTGEGRSGAVANTTYESVDAPEDTTYQDADVEEDTYNTVNMPDDDDDRDGYLALARSTSDTDSNYAAPAPRGAGDEDTYMTTEPPAADDPTYLDANDAGVTPADLSRPTGSVRNNLYGAVGVKQDPMYDELKASLPDNEYASTEELKPHRMLTEEETPANIYMAHRTESDLADPPFLAERKATVWELPIKTAVQESSEDADGGFPSLNGPGSPTSALAIRRASSQGGVVPEQLNINSLTLSRSPAYAGAPPFSAGSPVGSRDFEEAVSPSRKSTQTAIV